MRRRVRVVLFLWALTTRNKKRPALGPSPANAPPRNRTENLVIKSHLLCQLS